MTLAYLPKWTTQQILFLSFFFVRFEQYPTIKLMCYATVSTNCLAVYILVWIICNCYLVCGQLISFELMAGTGSQAGKQKWRPACDS